MLVRLLLTLFLLGNVGFAVATPLDLVNDARREVDHVGFTPGVDLTTEDSVVFSGFSSIYQNGMFRFLTKTNTTEDAQIVLDAAPGHESLYLKHDGKWSKADHEAIRGYVRNTLMPLIKTDLFLSYGDGTKPKPLMLYGPTCNYSRSEELYLDKNKIPHTVIPLAVYASAPPDVLCTTALSLRDWAKGKQIQFQYCEKKEQAAKYGNELNKILSAQGLEIYHFPMAILPSGEILERTEDMSEFNNKLKSL